MSQNIWALLRNRSVLSESLCIGLGFTAVSSATIFLNWIPVASRYLPSYSHSLDAAVGREPIIGISIIYGLVAIPVFLIIRIASPFFIAAAGTLIFMTSAVVLRVAQSAPLWDFFSKVWFLLALLFAIHLSTKKTYGIKELPGSGMQRSLATASCLFILALLSFWWLWRVAPLNSQNAITGVDVLYLVGAVLVSFAVSCFIFALERHLVSRRRSLMIRPAPHDLFLWGYLGILIFFLLDLHFGRGLTGNTSILFGVLLILVPFLAQNGLRVAPRIVLAFMGLTVWATSLFAPSLNSMGRGASSLYFYFLGSITNQSRASLAPGENHITTLVGADDAQLFEVLASSSYGTFMDLAKDALLSILAFPKFYVAKLELFFNYSLMPIVYGDDVGTTKITRTILEWLPLSTRLLISFVAISGVIFFVSLFFRDRNLAALIGLVVCSFFVVFMAGRYSLHQWWPLGLIGVIIISSGVGILVRSGARFFRGNVGDRQPVPALSNVPGKSTPPNLNHPVVLASAALASFVAILASFGYVERGIAEKSAPSGTLVGNTFFYELPPGPASWTLPNNSSAKAISVSTTGRGGCRRVSLEVPYSSVATLEQGNRVVFARIDLGDTLWVDAIPSGFSSYSYDRSPCWLEVKFAQRNFDGSMPIAYIQSPDPWAPNNSDIVTEATVRKEASTRDAFGIYVDHKKLTNPLLSSDDNPSPWTETERIAYLSGRYRTSIGYPTQNLIVVPMASRELNFASKFRGFHLQVQTQRSQLAIQLFDNRSDTLLATTFVGSMYDLDNRRDLLCFDLPTSVANHRDSYRIEVSAALDFHLTSEVGFEVTSPRPLSIRCPKNNSSRSSVFSFL